MTRLLVNQMCKNSMKIDPNPRQLQQTVYKLCKKLCLEIVVNDSVPLYALKSEKLSKSVNLLEL